LKNRKHILNNVYISLHILIFRYKYHMFGLKNAPGHPQAFGILRSQEVTRDVDAADASDAGNEAAPSEESSVVSMGTFGG
jgi:hypothetical protein